jgi:hypothetical protein
MTSFADCIVVVLVNTAILYLLFLGENERFLQEQHALHDGKQNTDRSYEVRQKVRIPSEKAILGEYVRVVVCRPSQIATHGRTDDTAHRPDKRLCRICASCFC